MCRWPVQRSMLSSPRRRSHGRTQCRLRHFVEQVVLGCFDNVMGTSWQHLGCSHMMVAVSSKTASARSSTRATPYSRAAAAGACRAVCLLLTNDGLVGLSWSQTVLNHLNNFYCGLTGLRPRNQHTPLTWCGLVWADSLNSVTPNYAQI
jgi:hypothetical protein